MLGGATGKPIKADITWPSNCAATPISRLSPRFAQRCQSAGLAVASVGWLSRRSQALAPVITLREIRTGAHTCPFRSTSTFRKAERNGPFRVRGQVEASNGTMFLHRTHKLDKQLFYLYLQYLKCMLRVSSQPSVFYLRPSRQIEPIHPFVHSIPSRQLVLACSRSASGPKLRNVLRFAWCDVCGTYLLCCAVWS